MIFRRRHHLPAALAGLVAAGIVGAAVAAASGFLVLPVVATALIVTAIGVHQLALGQWRGLQDRTENDASERIDERVGMFLRHTADVVVVVDRLATLQYVSPSASRLLRRPADSLRGTSLLPMLDPHDKAACQDVLDRIQDEVVDEVLDLTLSGAGDVSVDVEAVFSSREFDRELGGHVVVLRDLSERRAMEARLRYQALHDQLTGLGQRALFEDRVGHALAVADRTGGAVAVLVVDINDLKDVNQSLGHAAGDAVLCHVAHRLTSSLRRADSVGRLAGDHFGVLLEDIATVADVARTAERLRTAFTEPVKVGENDIYVSMTLGVALAPVRPDERSTRERAVALLQSAGVALDAAKKHGKSGLEMFAPEMHAAAVRRLELKADLQRAIEAGQFSMFFQPIVDLKTSRPVGMEALVRWHHPDRGMVPPDEFIPLAEETGLIIPLGRWILRESCRHASRWGDILGDAAPYVSVNVSPVQLKDDGLPADIDAALADHRLDPSRLVLELTESALAEDTASMEWRFERIRRPGLRIALDDFGTEYSAMSYLKRFHIDILKIDRGFVQGMTDVSHELTLVRAMIAMGHGLGLAVVAEGIENEDVRRQLRELRCDLGQGYLFSKPLPAHKALQLLEASRPRFERDAEPAAR